MTAGLDVLREEVRRRLSEKRLAHVESVARTMSEIASAAGWPRTAVDGALRAAWIHDALKEQGFDAWLRAIEEAGWEPDPWSLAHAPHLLHAPAAAAWALSRGESDPEVLDAVHHHPTAHPDWGDLGRLLYLADFAEPRRRFAGMANTAELRAMASEGSAGLREAARRILGLRIGWLMVRGRPVHPLSFAAWKAWDREPTR